jgi:hypothetical protein
MDTTIGLAGGTTHIRPHLSLVGIPVVTTRMTGLASIPVATTPIDMATTRLIVATDRIIAIGTTLSLGPVALLAVLDHLEILGIQATNLVRPFNSPSHLTSLEIEAGDLHLMTGPAQRRAGDLEVVHHNTVNCRLDPRSHPCPRPYKRYELRFHRDFDALT